MEKLKPLICPQCGGTINRARMVCEYCGTTFKDENNEIRVVAYRPGVHVLSSSVAIPKEYIVREPEEMAKYAIEQMAKKYANGIAQFMDVRTTEEPFDDTVVFHSRLRVLDNCESF